MKPDDSAIGNSKAAFQEEFYKENEASEEKGVAIH